MEYQHISGGFLINPYPFSDPSFNSSNKMNVKISPFSMQSPDMKDLWQTDYSLNTNKKDSSNEKNDFFFTPFKDEHLFESSKKKSSYRKKLIFEDEITPTECPKKIHREENDSVGMVKTKRTYSESTLSEKQNEDNKRYLMIHKIITQKRENSINNVETTLNLENPDLSSISSLTMNNLLSENSLLSRKTIVIDTRFSFEYQAGHIKNAININNPFHLEYFFFECGHLLLLKSFYEKLSQLKTINFVDLESIFKSLSEKPFESYKTEDFEENQPLIVIHCEFSQKRGPKLIRYLRKRDREINEDNYPNLIYPNVFLLKGGYSEFVKNNSNCCTDNGGYVSMFNEKFKIQCTKENTNYNKMWNEVKNIKFFTNFY